MGTEEYGSPPEGRETLPRGRKQFFRIRATPVRAP
ncbi:hypothetical protein RKD24_005270 [Streptomyces calvus]|jgi:hypothetical protein